METTGDYSKKGDIAPMRTGGSRAEQYGNQHGNSGKASPETSAQQRVLERMSAPNKVTSGKPGAPSAEPSQVEAEPIKKPEPPVQAHHSKPNNNNNEQY